MSCSSPTRLPRSLNESPAYDPAWRHLQVIEYLRHRRHQGVQADTFVLPSSEKDPLVRAYYKFRSGAVGLGLCRASQGAVANTAGDAS